MSLLWGGVVKAKAKRGRPTAPPRPQVFGCCEFCRNPFARTGRVDRPRRTCSVGCAIGLRKQRKVKRAHARFKAAHAAKWLVFPKEEVLDV